SVIIEEGFATSELERIVESMRIELEKNGAIVVSGDTKVVPKGSVDKIFINTSGIGKLLQKGISANNITTDDVILISRDIGAHGASIFAAREGMELSSSLQSDCTSLFSTVKVLIEEGVQITAMRDATRGGVSATLGEWAKASNISIEIEESAIAIRDEVRGICEMLGFEPLDLANEGTFLLAVKETQAQKALEILKRFHNNANIIGRVSQERSKKVVLKSPWGTSRFLEIPTGELLPRIC
ncbi:MAG: hydrogenase expression/formation protein HypE, partial [Sulfurimonadaceae bacterium]|nr:hydrogenase expression/formation protein HypE [Sulfurimonadaceae bacterium]